MRQLPLLVLPLLLCLFSVVGVPMTSGCAAMKVNPEKTVLTVAACTPGVASAAWEAAKGIPSQNWAKVTASVLVAAGDIERCVSEVRAINDAALAQLHPAIPPERLAALPVIAQAAQHLKMAADVAATPPVPK